MPEQKQITDEQLPDHPGDNDSLPEAGTPAGTVWRASNVPIPGSLSGGATGFRTPGVPAEREGAGSPDWEARGLTREPLNAHRAGPEPLTTGELNALRAAGEGAPPSPGDLSHESQYEESRDSGSGGQQETDAERRRRRSPAPGDETGGRKP